jgi:hypothetical protein
VESIGFLPWNDDRSPVFWRKMAEYSLASDLEAMPVPLKEEGGRRKEE